MNDLELKFLWRCQDAEPAGTPAGPAAAGADVVAGMKARLRKLDRKLFWRDARELIACALIVVWVGRDWFRPLPPVSRVGCAVMILSAVMIATVILIVRRRDREPREPESVADSLRRELRKVTRQERLLANVLWWYILPIFAGVELYARGFRRDLSDWWVSLLVYAVVGGVVWWMNRYVARKHFRPLGDEIRQTLRGLESLGETV